MSDRGGCQDRPKPENLWDTLFAADEGQAAARSIEMRVLPRHGRPFLLLPSDNRCATATLALYPAQTPRARAAKILLRWLLKSRVPVGLAKISLRISAENPFVKFLASMANDASGAVPIFGILAGNPASEGQRFLIPVFDP